jgi:propionyl-CoA carboxylase alpha chain
VHTTVDGSGNATRFAVEGALVDEAGITLSIDGTRRRFEVHTVGSSTWVNSADGESELVAHSRFRSIGIEESAGGPSAPVPGTVASIEVAVGDAVEAGQCLVVLEAMKVEHQIKAPGSAVVAEVLVAEGDQVDAHELLVRLEDGDS